LNPVEHLHTGSRREQRPSGSRRQAQLPVRRIRRARLGLPVRDEESGNQEGR